MAFTNNKRDLIKDPIIHFALLREPFKTIPIGLDLVTMHYAVNQSNINPRLSAA